MYKAWLAGNRNVGLGRAPVGCLEVVEEVPNLNFYRVLAAAVSWRPVTAAGVGRRLPPMPVIMYPLRIRVRVA